MPKHTIGTTYKDDAGSVPIGGTVYTFDLEANVDILVPAGTVNAAHVIQFAFAKVGAYCLSLATQSAAQAAANPQGFSEATTGAVLINVNSTSSPAPAITVNAKSPVAFAPAIPGTTNLFTANVTTFYLNNAGGTDLWLLVKIGLNT